MPVKKCENGKFRIGDGPCVYETEESATKAQIAYHTLRTVPTKLQFSENTPVEEIPNQVQLMRTCVFFHKQYGRVEITRQLFSEMIDNFEKNTRGIDVMIDYAHDSDREAAGWVKNLEIREVQLSEGTETTEPVFEHQLWATVEWTPKGRKTLSDKEFAYLSADFDPDYRDNENPTLKFGAVLLGAGLTNRPVIKRMNPAIQLSEFSEYDENQYKEKNLMEQDKKEMGEDKSLMENELGEMKKKLSDSEAKLAEIDELMNELGVSSLEELMKMIREMKTENVELAEEREKTEKENKLNVLLSEGKISQAQKDEAMKLESETFKGFVKLAEMNQPVVKLDEEGSNETPTEETKVDDIEAKVLELAEKAIEDKKANKISDAIRMVLGENKELASQYYGENK